jgi:hypothetical protein
MNPCPCLADRQGHGGAARLLVGRCPPALLAVILLVTPLSGAAADLGLPGPASPRHAVIDTAAPAHPFCSTRLLPAASERLLGRFCASGDYSFSAGLWVGAIVDRGSGSDTSVSASMYQFEFCRAALPGDRVNLHPLQKKIRVAYTDTCAALTSSPHTPLAVRVVQTSALKWNPRAGDYVRMEFRVQNISHRGLDPGWDLEMVYFGIMMDPNLRTDDRDLEYWNDDQVAVVPGWWQDGGSVHTSTRGGDLVYAFEDPFAHPEDLFDGQVGVASLDAPLHVFRVWSGGAQDPTSDVDRYLLLRGDSDLEPTIDPPTVRATDYRFLISVGPFERIEPQETERFTVALVCGRLVSDPPGGLPVVQGVPRAMSAPAWSHPLTVSPNPVRLSTAGGSHLVRFTGLPRDGTIGVYSVQGRLVRSLAAGESGSAIWDLRESAGTIVLPGIYFYRVATSAGESQLGKLVVLR